MKSFIALFVAIVSLSVASAAETDINFNFEGMIPAAGSGRPEPKAHHVNVFEVSTTDVTTPGFEGEDSAPLMTSMSTLPTLWLSINSTTNLNTHTRTNLI
jgi:hypothetical protein